MVGWLPAAIPPYIAHSAAAAQTADIQQ